MGGYLDLAVGCCNTGTGCIGFIFFRSTFVWETQRAWALFFWLGFLRDFQGGYGHIWSRVFNKKNSGLPKKPW